ncbi:agmatinase [Cognatishimia sp. 1_MG-2023]|uniref:agmatinase n=1 Tax=Cognatishimia sp. 1_MG-2023 TaxID=3062642 RepID=UPI0026E26572|nr:agmatinase [Cognatishimia sp. 1_MG-2023]MDO6728213.1 agmatinase [Cognatishimia sp. 1_MG-2023]
MTIALLGLPQDNNASYLSGPALAPQRIREALWSDSANMFTETGLDLGDPTIWTDSGNVALEGLTGQSAYDAIYSAVTQRIAQGHRLVSLGGDHSIAFPVIHAHANAYEGLNILHIDAHPDLYDNMLDNKFSHASPFARLMETGKIARLVQVGIRTQNAHQKAQAEKFGVETHEMRDLSKLADLQFEGPVYLSFDLDALDPAFAPGVSHFEPGGLSTRQGLDIIQNFKGQLVGADVVELNPLRDANGMTAMVAAKLAKELIARLVADQDASDR